MTPPAAVTSPTAARHLAWVDNTGVGHRRDTVRTGCNTYSLTELVPVPVAETDRHGVRPCYDRRCFPNGFRQYRSAA